MNAKVLLFSPNCMSQHQELLKAAISDNLVDKLTRHTMTGHLNVYKLFGSGALYRLKVLATDDPLKDMIFQEKTLSTIPLADENGDPRIVPNDEGIIEYAYGESFMRLKGRAAMTHMRLMEVRTGKKVRTYFSFMEFIEENLEWTPWFSLEEFTAIEGEDGFVNALKNQLGVGFQRYQFKCE